MLCVLFEDKDIYVTLNMLTGIPIWSVFDGNT